MIGWEQKGNRSLRLAFVVIGVILSLMVVPNVAIAKQIENARPRLGLAPITQLLSKTKSSTTPSAPTTVGGAREDASQIARNLCLLDEEEGDLEDVADDVELYLKRLDQDVKVLEQAYKNANEKEAPQLKRYLCAAQNIQQTLIAEKGLLDAITPILEIDENATIEDYYEALSQTSDAFTKIEGPEYIVGLMEDVNESFLVPEMKALQYLYQSQDAAQKGTGTEVLALYGAKELIAWSEAGITQPFSLLNNVVNAQYRESEAVLCDKASDDLEFEASAEKTISPNLYPSMDSALNLMVTSPKAGEKVTVSVEIVGFSQKWEETIKLEQGVNLYRIKPSLLPEKRLKDLEKGKDTQIELRVTDANDKKLYKKSYHVDIRSIYSFDWVNDEFGVTSAFNILAWMRPTCDEVDQVIRRANDYMEYWTGNPMAGHQFGDQDALYTALQAAAIQSAISEAGVKYQMDGYSLSGEQSVLTPDAVINKKHGLCIETTLLMASCLQRMSMHPIIILTPGHAQCAVEMAPDSGYYYLLETTDLPYEVNTNASADSVDFYNDFLVPDLVDGDAQAWQTYLSSQFSDELEAEGDSLGGIFVIDCDLMDVLNIKGLEI